MHQIELSQENEPNFLAEYAKGISCQECDKFNACTKKTKGTRPWGCWRAGDKDKLNHQLALRQEWRAPNHCLCAYCEQLIDMSNKKNFHIDHIVQRAKDKGQIFDWSNIVISCEGITTDDINSSCCGRTKDRQKYEVIHPIREDARRFISFYRDNGGVVDAAPNPSLSNEAKSKSQQSIDALKLNIPALRAKRYKAYTSIAQRVQSLQTLRKNGHPCYTDRYTKLINDIKSRAFCSSLLAIVNRKLPPSPIVS